MSDKTQEETKELPTDVAAAEKDIAKEDGLGRREALEVALELSKPLDEIIAADEAESAKKPNRSAKELKSEESKELPPLAPPSEWNAEEKEDFNKSSRKAQEASLRLHKSRMKTLNEIKAGYSEINEYKDLIKNLNPFLKSVGINQPTEVALKKALMAWNEIENGDTKKAVAQILKQKGIDVPDSFLSDNSNPELEGKILPLQEKINQLESKITQGEQAQVVSQLQRAWGAFESEKNATGQSLYPDLGNTESGIAMASRIGSLVGGNTDLSRQFIANVKARNPDADMRTFFREAYVFNGGRINEASHTAGTQPQNNNLKQMVRATVSQPSRAANSAANANGDGKKYKTYREALAAAMADLSD